MALGDEALFDGLRAGSEAHFNVLYDRYFARIYSYLALRVRSRADAEELTQEVFTAVFRSASGYGDSSSPLSWIYGIARNTALSYVRRQQAESAKEERMLRGVAVLPASPEWTFTPEERVREERLSAEIERRMGTLAPCQLDAFRLRHLEDLTIEEISRRTQRSADAVRSGLYRAKRMLFDAAEIEGGDE
ncbi:MAG: sigma-70 family RNA polymerase sigma factor [Deltaproteobacteria bacterium]|nr:sigma-70 family RNA polymerase sigma factor [Deltaproteobacteria bacterium]